MIHPTAVIHPDVEIGTNAHIGPYVVIGEPGETRLSNRPAGRVRIGDNAEIREHARIQSGVDDYTVVGDDVMLMAGSHIAHDCWVGNAVTVATNATLAGHVTLADFVFVGISASIHQRATVGYGTLIGAGAFLKGFTGEWEIWAGVPARRIGRNLVGIHRRYTKTVSHDMGARW